MGFKEEIQRLSRQISERKAHISNEETTKHSLIIPFIQVLGYDVFDPLEVQPEYDADFGKKKGEKVDYAIFKNGRPIIFIEAKSVNDKLDNHNAQLSRYFNSTPEVKIAILTNGVQYKFFTDLNQNNVMDTSPFFEVKFEDLTESEIENLSQFRKDTFDSEGLVKYAEELIYMANLHKNLKELFKNPSDEFIRFLIKDFSGTRITSNVIDRFRPIVKKSISKALLDIVSQGLSQEVSPVTEDVIPVTPLEEHQATDNSDLIGKKLITTEEEIKAFESIRGILDKNGRDTSQLGYKDTTNYLGIHHRNPSGWFVRLNFDTSNKHVITRLPIEKTRSLANGFKVEASVKGLGESRVFIRSLDELKQLEQLILTCFDQEAVS